MQFDTPVLYTDYFTWNPRTRSFVAEISALQAILPNIFGFTQITLINPKTNGMQTFTSEERIQDPEGGVISWNWVSGDGLRIVIFND